jgi:hypothetical protein
MKALVIGGQLTHPSRESGIIHAAMSTEAARRALEEQTGGPVPEGLNVLSDDELRHLAEAIRTARSRQAEALAAAGERALGKIPRLLRGPVRRVVG